MSTDQQRSNNHRVRTKEERLRSLLRRPDQDPVVKAVAEAALENLQSDGDSS